MEKMPAMVVNRMNGNATTTSTISITGISDELESAGDNHTKEKSNTDTLLDLLGSGDDIIMTSTPSIVVPSVPATSNLLDLLGDLDLTTPVPLNNNYNQPLPLSTMSILDDNDNTTKVIPDVALNGASSVGTFDLGLDFLTSSDDTATSKVLTAFDKNDLLVQLAATKQLDQLQVIMTATNNSMDTLEQYLFQV